MRFEVPVYGKGICANCFRVIVFGIVSGKLVVCGRCKHVCAGFEFEVTDCFAEHSGVEFHLFTVGLSNMFPRGAFLFWWANEGESTEAFWYEEDVNVRVKVDMVMVSFWLVMSSRRDGG